MLLKRYVEYIGLYLGIALTALLSVGLGMISGSIQHFDDFPH